MRDKIKVAFVSKIFSPNAGGGGQVSAYLLAEALSELAEVHVVTSKGTTSSTPSKFKVHPIIENRTLPNILEHITRNEIFYYDTYNALNKFLKEQDIDVLHALNMDAIPGTILAAKKFKIPSVITINSHWLTCPYGVMLKLKDTSICDGDCSFWNATKCYYYSSGVQRVMGPFYYPVQMYTRRKLSEKADAIICVSDNMKNYVAKLYPHKKIISMPSDIIESTASEKVSKLESDLLYVGALGGYKGCEYLIEAMEYIVKEFYNCRLRIVGDGPRRNEFELLSRSKGLENNISFEGFMEHSKLPAYYASTKIVIFPSIIPETFGRIAPEAMVMGKPVIASRIGGILETVKHGENGMIVQPKNARDIADAAIYLLKNEELAKKMGENGKVFVQNRYSSSMIAKNYLHLYEELLDNFILR